MVILKFFILNSGLTETDLEDLIKDAAGKLNYPVNLTLVTDHYVTELPRDYDGYLIHLSNTSEEAIKELRKEQPWSKIFGVSGGYFWGGGYSLKELDAVYDILQLELDLGIAESMLRKTNEIYTVKKGQ